MDLSGKLVSKTKIHPGTTIAYFNVQTIYEGTYIVLLTRNETRFSKKVMVTRN